MFFFIIHYYILHFIYDFSIILGASFFILNYLLYLCVSYYGFDR